MNDSEVLKKALSILKEGGLVAIPTETVYGLAADVNNENALKKIFAAKNRPIDHPLIVHIGDDAQLKKYSTNISDEAILLAKTFWPGPLTLILKKSATVSKVITGGQETIGIRIPDHPLTLKLLKKFGRGVAAPSANKFGRISPTTAKAVLEELGNGVDYILDGGQCDVGIESTIVDASSKEIKILRPGVISAKQIEAVLNHPLSEKNNKAPRVSGALKSHYAPRTPTFLLSRKDIEKVAHPSSAVIFFGKKPLVFDQQIYTVEMPVTPKNYAHDLYHVLRELDKNQFSKILIERVPQDPAWNAILDRLMKATQ